MLKIQHLFINILHKNNDQLAYQLVKILYFLLNSIYFYFFIPENTKYQSLHCQSSGQTDLGRMAWNGSGKVGLHSPRSLCEESRILHRTIPRLYLQGRTFPASVSWNQSLPAIISLNPCSSCGLCQPQCAIWCWLCATMASLLPGLGEFPYAQSISRSSAV